MSTVRCADCGSTEIHAPEWTHANRQEIIAGDPYSTSEYWCVRCDAHTAVTYDDTTPFDPDACPKCGVHGFEVTWSEHEQGTYREDRSCTPCGYAWRTVFAFDHHAREGS